LCLIRPEVGRWTMLSPGYRELTGESQVGKKMSRWCDDAVVPVLLPVVRARIMAVAFLSPAAQRFTISLAKAGRMLSLSSATN